MTFDFESAAAKLFGDDHPTRVSPTVDRVEHSDLASTMFPREAQSDLDRQAQQLARQRAQFGQPKQAPVLDDDARSQVMFNSGDPTKTHADATQAIINSALEDHLHDPETAGEIAASWAETFQEHNLSATDSKALADIGAQVMRNPPTPELISTWTETAIQSLQAEYGVTGAGQALQDAQDYVHSHPGLPDLLDALGLGSHPKLVAIAAARGRAMRLAGRLK